MLVIDNVRFFYQSDKKYYPQTLLKECKYEIENNKTENLIDNDLDPSSSDNDSDSDHETDNESVNESND